jgi:hypothetical protein
LDRAQPPLQSGAVANPKRALEELEAAPLDALLQQHPALWAEVGPRLVAAAKGGPAALEAFGRAARAAEKEWRERLRRSHGDPAVLSRALPALVAARMARLGLERTLLAAATGAEQGSVTLGLWSGLLAQRLFFSAGLSRKQVSLRAFRLLWPLLTRKRALLPLLQQKGVYCFYSDALIAALVHLLDGREALEVAAGDGTLARLLNAAGAKVTPSDDQSWKHAIAYPPEVEKRSAAEAVARANPRAVLCSYPPPGNSFEAQILAAPSVELYVVLGSRHRYAAGDWAAYKRQTAFAWGPDEALSKLLLPPEIDPLVLVFRRK